jgi:glycosyltransferase involved in cell wall biosynthesis
VFDPDQQNSDSSVEECPHYESKPGYKGQAGQCRLLKRILRTDEPAFSAVNRDACEACCRSDFPSTRLFNNVIASLVHASARRIIERNGVAGCDVARAEELQEFAISEVARTTLRSRQPTQKTNGQKTDVLPGRARLYSCDVVVCCTDESDRTVAAAESVIDQRDVRAIIHLVDDGGGAAGVTSQFDDNDRVVVHRNEKPLGLFSTMTKLLPELQSRYVAFQDPRSISRPDRLKRTIDLLERQGGEIGVTAVESADGVLVPETPDGPAENTLPWQSLVIRRNTLLDLQRMHGSSINDISSLVKHAVEDGRLISLARRVTVDINHQAGDAAESTPARTTSWVKRPASVTQPRPAVDVVLPFHNTIDFVHESLQSMLEQTGVDVVVHLIDDASTVDTSQDLERWGRDPRIRVYRNSRNLGPYMSFNNVSRFFETEFVAIQDADDISLPHRLSAGVASLRDSNADIFGAAVEMFGDNLERASKTNASNGKDDSLPVTQFRFSRYPATQGVVFVINGSTVMRTRTFHRLGGFADYGKPERNRCGLDSEFYTRAFFAGANFFVSRDVVLKCRRHADSLTQNSETGWGTARRQFAREKLLERIELYRNYEFDPQDFGGLNLDYYPCLTERVLQANTRRT